jgi:hypothetical protein
MEPNDLWDTLKGVMHVNWVILGMNNTPLIAQTKIVEPMVFIDYPNEGIAFLLSFVMAMQYPSNSLD